MSITVYSVSGAPRPWRVLLGLTFKKLEYDVNLLQASKSEHKSAEYLTVHPRGTVPALRYKNMVLRDSIGILAWLDRQFPERPLFGETPEKAAHIWQIALDACDYLRSATNDVLFLLLVRGVSVSSLNQEERKAIFSAAKRLKEECVNLNNLLDEGMFLAGSEPTAADAICFPEIQLVERAIETKSEDMEMLGLSQLFNELAELNDWKNRVSLLPNVDKTMPSHWS